MPNRLQRGRSQDYELPEGSVYVGGKGRWGDPFCNPAEFDMVLGLILLGKTREEIDIRSTLYLHMRNIALTIEELRGKDLACNCRLEKPCHADSLLKFANR